VSRQDDIFLENTIDRSSQSTVLDFMHGVPVKVIDCKVCADTITRAPEFDRVTNSSDGPSKIGAGNHILLDTIKLASVLIDEMLLK
jgi:hypothetical protein